MTDRTTEALAHINRERRAAKRLANMVAMLLIVDTEQNAYGPGETHHLTEKALKAYRRACLPKSTK